MKASVIIPAYNAQDTISKTIIALENQTIDRTEYEIIIVDDCSTDSTASVVNSFNNCILIVQETNKGPAAARNSGAETAKSEMLLFTDADCEPTSNWIEEMLKTFQTEDIVGVKGIYKTKQKNILSNFVQLEYELKYERMKKVKHIDFIDTYSAGYRRGIFSAYKGFDETFKTASVEDQEFSFRLANAGLKMLFNPNAVVFHFHVTTIKNYIRRKFNIGFWKVLVLRRYPLKAFRDSHTPNDEKFQIVIVALLFSIILAEILFGYTFLVFPSLAVGSGLFLLFSLNAILFMLRSNFLIGILAPAFLFLRGISLLAGLVYGFLKSLCKKST